MESIDPGTFAPQDIERRLGELLTELEIAVETAYDAAEDAAEAERKFEALRVFWIGQKQGRLKQVQSWMGKVHPDDKRAFGVLFNNFKQNVENLFAPYRSVTGALQPITGLRDKPVQPAVGTRAGSGRNIKAAGLDISLPGLVRVPGVAHPSARDDGAGGGGVSSTGLQQRAGAAGGE